MMMPALFLISLIGGETFDQLVKAENYLDAGGLLRPAAHRLESPAAIRAYTDFLTTNYSYQVGFRTFFVKNLVPGERLELLRKASAPVKISTESAIIEDNFEALLLKAQKKWPDHVEMRFALASYAFHARCCAMQPKIKMSMPEIIAAFEAGHESGVETTTSRFAIGLSLTKPKDLPRATLLLEQAHQAAPLDADIQYAWLNNLLVNRKYKEAVNQGRYLMESTVNPEIKADALTGVARAYQAMDEYDKSQIAVDNGSKMRPGDPFLWMIGLENFRKKRDLTGYTRYISDYLDRNRESPEPFRRYLEFIRFKKYQPYDETFVQDYAKREEKTPLAKVIQHYNLGAMFQVLGRYPEAAPHFKNALELAQKLDNPPPPMLKTIKKRLAAVTAEQTSDKN